MGLAPNPGGKQTRYPFNCLGKKMSAGMSPSKGHSDCHCDNSQVCCFPMRQKFLAFIQSHLSGLAAALYLEGELKRDSSERMQVLWSRTDLRANSLRDRNGRICLEVQADAGHKESIPGSPGLFPSALLSGYLKQGVGQDLTGKKNSHEGQTWSVLVFSGPMRLRVKRLSLVMTLGLRILLVRHQFNKLWNSPGCRSCLFPEGEEPDSERSSWYGQIFFGQLCSFTYVVETQVCTWVLLSPRAGCRRVGALTRRLSSREGAS